MSNTSNTSSVAATNKAYKVVFSTMTQDEYGLTFFRPVEFEIVASSFTEVYSYVYRHYQVVGGISIEEVTSQIEKNKEN